MYNKVFENILLKKGFNSGKDLSNSFVKRTANLLFLIKLSLALHSDFKVKMVYNKFEFGL